MGIITFQAGQRANLRELRESIVVAIDLGFSQKSKSTGIAWRPVEEEHPSRQSFTFARGVEHVIELIQDVTIATLILEAPLSAHFGKNGNPAIRDEFERRFDEGKGKNVSRPWYSGPGAATLLSALFFLRRIRQEIEKQTGMPRVVLFEGLHTFKTGATDHSLDASELLQAFFDGDVIDVTQAPETEWLSVLQLIDGESNTAIPGIVTVNREPTESETIKPETN